MEAALIILLGATIVLSLAVVPDWLTGLPLLMVAGLILVRIVRWKIWHCPERPDLLMLATGYGWLAAGSAITAWHLLAGKPAAPALHLITVGALGTLSTGVMLRLAWQRAYRRFPHMAGTGSRPAYLGCSHYPLPRGLDAVCRACPALVFRWPLEPCLPDRGRSADNALAARNQGSEMIGYLYFPLWPAHYPVGNTTGLTYCF